ncbi:MAG: hypothetical protein A2033_03745 [Bacteroidetes bacterium GWA2_31_9]|nr:MAG: hypothetical protein A2033_03745 [Bacteroidetes bacterium GWA2_31_9]
MITQQYFDFLSGLKANNDKIWFTENKPQYEKLKSDFEKIVSELINEVSIFEPKVSILKPKDCVFRIYKDVRFSKDKLPYKTNMGAFFVPGGKKSGMAGYYIHIEPGACFLGGGIYMPQPPILKNIRDEVYYNYEEFLKVISEKNFVKYFKTISGSKTTLIPKGFPKDFAGADYLKFKDFTVLHEVKDNFLTDKSALKNTIEIFKAMKPFNDFLNTTFVS